MSDINQSRNVGIGLTNEILLHAERREWMCFARVACLSGGTLFARLIRSSELHLRRYSDGSCDMGQCVGETAT